MSQFGMQMPGGMARRGPSMNVYTGLAFAAVMALAAASIFVFVQAGKIGVDGDPWGIQEAKSGEASAIKLGNP